MGLFDDFDIDIDDVKEAGGFEFEDGHYNFEISEALRQNGTKKDPDDTKFIIKYDLDEAGVYWEWYTIAVDGDSAHPKAKQSLGFLKGRLLDLGFKAAELRDLDLETELEGIVGTLELRTTSGKGKNAGNKYQNVRNVKVAADEPEEEDEEPAPAPPAKSAETEAKRRVAARQSARAAKEEPVKAEAAPRRRRPAAAAEDDNENPFE